MTPAGRLRICLGEPSPGVFRLLTTVLPDLLLHQKGHSPLMLPPQFPGAFLLQPDIRKSHFPGRRIVNPTYRNIISIEVLPPDLLRVKAIRLVRLLPQRLLTSIKT